MDRSTNSARGGTGALIEGLVRRVDAIPLADTAPDDDLAERIVAAAREQIELLGWRRTTMDDVARRAGLGRATVYRRFPSKSDLLDAVLVGELLRYYAMRSPIDSSMSTVDRIVESAVVTVSFVRDNAMLNRMLDLEPEVVLPALTRDVGPLFDFVADMAIPVWKEQIHPDRDLTADELQHWRTVSELHARLTLAFIHTRDSRIPLTTESEVRLFARHYLAPMVLAPPPPTIG